MDYIIISSSTKNKNGNRNENECKWILSKEKHLNSIGVAMKFASITVGAWQDDPSNAIAMPQRNTVTPVSIISCYNKRL